MTTDLRNELVPFIQDHQWEQVGAFIERHAQTPAAKDLVVLGRGMREALEGDLDTGIGVLGEAVALGNVDARLQRALLRTLADQEWDQVIEDVAALKHTALAFDDQRSLYELLLEKVADQLQSRREFPRALETWNELLARVPDLALGFQRRSRCHFHLGQLELALKDADRHLELEPENRLAWLGRAAVKKALGDLDGAAADEKAGAPFYDLQVSAEVRAQAKTLLEGDRDQNLNARLNFFQEMGLPHLDVALQVLEEEWVFCFIPSEDERLDLSFTVGFFYRFGHPELMFHSRDVDFDVMKQAVTELLERVRDGHVVKAGDTLELDGRSVTFTVPTAQDLVDYPYGYGGHFYRHFMDRTDVPLLLARLA